MSMCTVSPMNEQDRIEWTEPAPPPKPILRTLIAGSSTAPARPATRADLDAALSALGLHAAPKDDPELDRVARVIRTVESWTPECRAGLVGELLTRYPEALDSLGLKAVSKDSVFATERAEKAEAERDEARREAERNWNKWQSREANIEDCETCEKQLKVEIARLQAELAMLRTSIDGVWLWQGNGDYPESLVCPVVMSAETLRGLVSSPPPREPAVCALGWLGLWPWRAPELLPVIGGASVLFAGENYSAAATEMARWPEETVPVDIEVKPDSVFMAVSKSPFATPVRECTQALAWLLYWSAPPRDVTPPAEQPGGERDGAGWERLSTIIENGGSPGAIKNQVSVMLAVPRAELRAAREKIAVLEAQTLHQSSTLIWDAGKIDTLSRTLDALRSRCSRQRKELRRLNRSHAFRVAEMARIHASNESLFESNSVLHRELAESKKRCAELAQDEAELDGVKEALTEVDEDYGPEGCSAEDIVRRLLAELAALRAKEEPEKVWARAFEEGYNHWFRGGKFEERKVYSPPAPVAPPEQAECLCPALPTAQLSECPVHGVNRPGQGKHAKHEAVVMAAEAMRREAEKAAPVCKTCGGAKSVLSGPEGEMDPCGDCNGTGKR